MIDTVDKAAVFLNAQSTIMKFLATEDSTKMLSGSIDLLLKYYYDNEKLKETQNVKNV